jgi:proteasome lid subunit RPN8/RPN11
VICFHIIAKPIPYFHTLAKMSAVSYLFLTLANYAPRNMSTLTIPRAIYNRLRAHGEETYPYECCGALLGRPGPDGWHVIDAVRAGNTRTDSAHNRYNIAPLELVKIKREANLQGLEIAGFYHSHPDHPARWSTTDFAEAHWLGCCYMITEVAQGKAAATTSFLLAGTTEEDKRFEQQNIVVEDESTGVSPAEFK